MIATQIFPFLTAESRFLRTSTLNSPPVTATASSAQTERANRLSWKVLSGELEPTTGEVVITPGERMAVLRQNHFEFDSYEVLQTVIMGHKRLYEIMKEKDELYAKEDFTDADGERASELEGEFAELDGWSAESNAETILTGLGISLDLEHKLMSELDGSQKVKVLLAQALFGNPDILLLDEPTNYLDIQSVRWLENFLLDFPNTVIVVSHDRHFLNKVCTHICDIDFGKIQMYVGNYDFWYEYTQMVARQQKDIDKKNEQKIKELQTFIQRFSANASKHKQATSRKKLLDNLQMENYYTPSSRRYPYIAWKPDRDIGNDLLTVTNLSKTVNGRKVLNNISFVLTPGDKGGLRRHGRAGAHHAVPDSHGRDGAGRGQLQVGA